MLNSTKNMTALLLWIMIICRALSNYCNALHTETDPREDGETKGEFQSNTVLPTPAHLKQTHERNPCPQNFEYRNFGKIQYIVVECDRTRALPSEFHGFECHQATLTLFDETSRRDLEYNSGCELHCIDECQEHSNGLKLHGASATNFSKKNIAHHYRMWMGYLSLGILVVMIILILMYIYIGRKVSHSRRSDPIRLDIYQV